MLRQSPSPWSSASCAQQPCSSASPEWHTGAGGGAPWTPSVEKAAVAFPSDCAWAGGVGGRPACPPHLQSPCACVGWGCTWDAGRGGVHQPSLHTCCLLLPRVVVGAVPLSCFASKFQ